MYLSDFDYVIPEELIAQFPNSKRSSSRLLVLDGTTGNTQDKHFFNLPDLLNPNDLLIFNDTRVMPARFLGHKSTGGKIEVVVERLLDTHHVLAQIRASRSPQKGTVLVLEETFEAFVIGRRGDLFELRFEDERTTLQLLEQCGRIPLPPYINRPVEQLDKHSYQTVYADKVGAVAAPTAGLHFDDTLLEKIKTQGVKMAYITLHVGLGTYQPVRTENITQHKMHAEHIDVSKKVCEQICQTQQREGRVIAVGTTTVRSLETVANKSEKSGQMQPYKGDTKLFIYPGYQFRVVDALITNFHLPKSTLLMMVSAFAGKENVFNAYQYAITQKYRFFSYGDAMFISKK